MPTPVVGVLGVLDDVEASISTVLPQDNSELYLVGETFDEFGGSIWQQVSGSGLSGLPPRVDLSNEQRLGEFVRGAAADQLISAAHDLSEGGLGQTLAELAIHADKGLDVDVSSVHPDLFTALFSESASRIAIATHRGEELSARAQEFGVPITKVGSSVDSGSLSVTGTNTTVEIPVAQLRQAWTDTLPTLFGHAVGTNAVVD